jgi:hypothetical protein
VKSRIISSILIIVYSIGLQALLLDLFPNPGPGTMGTVPITFMISVILALLNFFLLKKIIGLWKRLAYFLILLIGFSIFSVKFYPQEEPFQQVSLAYDLYKNPDKIKYEHLFKLNYQKEAVYVTAALVKFRDSIPDQAFRISYCCEPLEEFYIAKYGTKYLTNNAHLLIYTASKRDTVIFKDTFKGETVEFNSPPDIFGKRTGWGHYIDNETRENMINYDKCELKPKEGFNRIYYDFLK